MTISERFPCLSPLSIRRTPAREVFILIARLADYSERTAKEKGKAPRQTVKGNVIYRPAGDDWF